MIVADFRFNKSHATCYSWVAYQTAFLKANYPAEYMAALMSRSLSDSPTIDKLVNECQLMGIEISGLSDKTVFKHFIPKSENVICCI